MAKFRLAMRTHNRLQRWIGFADGSKYAGVTTRTLELWDKAGHIRVARVSPFGTKGRRLIDVESLDAFIESWVGTPPAQLAVNAAKMGTTTEAAAGGRL
jgi:hypothetical protein